MAAGLEGLEAGLQGEQLSAARSPPLVSAEAVLSKLKSDGTFDHIRKMCVAAVQEEVMNSCPSVIQSAHLTSFFLMSLSSHPTGHRKSMWRSSPGDFYMITGGRRAQTRTKFGLNYAHMC